MIIFFIIFCINATHIAKKFNKTEIKQDPTIIIYYIHIGTVHARPVRYATGFFWMISLRAAAGASFSKKNILVLSKVYRSIDT
jgi:hypothetical protein